jgi:phosphopantothenoylcysteine decarboxylase/phosphopantothenate--cysteine ligase
MKDKKILLGISGGIAAYKMATLTRLLVKAGASVRVVMTEEAQAFITPLTLATLSKNPVLSRLYNPQDGTWHNHVDLGLWADLMLIAPATANTLAKMAAGQADNLLLTTYLSARCPVWAAPAMDLDMWQHPATQRNLETLRRDAVHILPPASGELASGLSGPGRLPEPEEIAAALAAWFSGEGLSASAGDSRSNQEALPLKGKKALITAGPTYEALDPVRFIGNHSSGKMGIAVAEALAALGAEVVLVKGPTSLKSRSAGVRERAVSSAESMFEACSAEFADSDIFVAAAAVADYRPESPSNQKIKKQEADGDRMTVTLVKTPDILAEMGRRKKPGQLVVGFALETENELENALSKLERKNLDLIVLNSLNDEGAGFGVDTNRISLIENRNRIDNFPLMSKTDAARAIAGRIVELLA